jgi:hypothetical protein
MLMQRPAMRLLLLLLINFDQGWSYAVEHRDVRERRNHKV